MSVCHFQLVCLGDRPHFSHCCARFGKWQEKFQVLVVMFFTVCTKAWHKLLGKWGDQCLIIWIHLFNILHLWDLFFIEATCLLTIVGS